MIKELKMQSWKSFKDATLYIDQLTVLIGTNSSGKSNCLDALAFLNKIAMGMSLTSAIKGEGAYPGLRGGIEWAALKPSNKFSLSVICENKTDERTDYVYTIEVIFTDGRCEIHSESLIRKKYRQGTRSNPYTIKLFWTEPCLETDPYINAKLYNEKSGTLRQSSRSMPVLMQLYQQKLRHEISEGIINTVECLQEIFILDPIPSHMRSFSSLSEQLENDASNIAGVIAALPDKAAIEEKITQYLTKLPEKDINRIYAEKVGKFQTDAMLYCEEAWEKPSNITTIDARGLSDGTLRFVAIVTALLTRPPRSLLIVEEIDNGLHPSRAGLLVKMLREIGQQRKVDILFTTHNPSTLDALGSENIPFIFITHRDKNSYSTITPLDQIDPLVQLVACGPLGKISSSGQLESILKGH